MATEVLQEGETCWRIAQADRMAVIIDAADYFRVARDAILHARHSVMLIGWDFDTRIKLDPHDDSDAPNDLGKLIKWVVKRRPELQVHILKWNLGALQSFGRGDTPLVILNWVLSPRVHVRLDHAHPAVAAHHQKIVVIDDSLAFCGGIDMTADRWDTPAHADDDPCRVTPSGNPTKPWHDATLAVDGDLARALGELARRRWELATDEALTPPPTGVSIWPAHLEPTFEGVEAGIARTFPTHEDRDEVREIEAFYLDAIAAATDAIYFESQYFASRAIAEAIARRLAEPEGPEFVLVMPEHAEGWLRRKAMDGARQKLLQEVWRGDVHGRFAAYYPVTAKEVAIYVHAKVTVVDDRVLRVGSSNLNNRSLGFDSECDIVLDAGLGGGAQTERDTIHAVRSTLLSEHLGVDPATFEAALAETGSLIAAIETLRRDEGRSLRQFTHTVISDDDSVLAENELADPEEAEPDLLARLGNAVTDLAEKQE